VGAYALAIVRAALADADGPPQPAVEAEAYATVRGTRLVFADVPAGITRLLTITGLSLSGPEIA